MWKGEGKGRTLNKLLPFGPPLEAPLQAVRNPLAGEFLACGLEGAI